ncbi:saccharopine dehydrogenase NADP-binding domain-containing protein [Lysinibacillus sp. NPDC097287]|uniref:saccharopine dehydrogenase NADP-binding domain-containing protein n=1 Tax=Lysinibacillus sp. NPDC097287 TaxID=3364144 RepID=UPI0038244FD7
MMKYSNSITILGSSGGVAKAILSVLNKSVQDKYDPLNAVIENSLIHLIDKKQVDKAYFEQHFTNLKNQFAFHQFDLTESKKLIEHLKKTNTTVVIDVSWADTVEMMQCCDQLGVDYVNTALENPYIDENEELFEGFGLIERLRHLEKHKDSISNSASIICSGMNPGVVQWMAIELLKKEPTKEVPLACYIVEHDSSFYKDKKKAKKNTIYTTWSPECFLDEAILSYPMFMSQKTPLFLYENVYDLEFKVTLGDKQFYGSLMPHEEVYTLGKLYNMESGFLYKINDHTTELILTNIEDVDKLWDFEMKVLDPMDGALEGEDLCGVLLVYNDREKYMYNVLKNEDIFSKYQTNATYFQVACGVYASLAVLLLDDIENGAYYVDELLVHTNNHFGDYLTYYMTDFVIGENNKTDGLLLERIRRNKK